MACCSCWRAEARAADGIMDSLAAVAVSSASMSASWPSNVSWSIALATCSRESTACLSATACSASSMAVLMAPSADWPDDVRAAIRCSSSLFRAGMAVFHCMNVWACLRAQATASATASSCEWQRRRSSMLLICAVPASQRKASSASLCCPLLKIPWLVFQRLELMNVSLFSSLVAPFARVSTFR